MIMQIRSAMEWQKMSEPPDRCKIIGTDTNLWQKQEIRIIKINKNNTDKYQTVTLCIWLWACLVPFVYPLFWFLVFDFCFDSCLRLLPAPWYFCLWFLDSACVLTILLPFVLDTTNLCLSGYDFLPGNKLRSLHLPWSASGSLPERNTFIIYWLSWIYCIFCITQTIWWFCGSSLNNVFSDCWCLSGL